MHLLVGSCGSSHSANQLPGAILAHALAINEPAFSLRRKLADRGCEFGAYSMPRIACPRAWLATAGRFPRPIMHSAANAAANRASDPGSGASMITASMLVRLFAPAMIVRIPVSE